MRIYENRIIKCSVNSLKQNQLLEYFQKNPISKQKC